VPPNTTATALLPTTALDAVLESGAPVASQVGISEAVVAEGLFRAKVASGTYRFTSTLPAK
jgi:hypothetical protein